jgi:hypothetical protein
MSASSQGGKFDSSLGGMALRYGEVSGVIGVFEAPDNPMPLGMAFPSGGTAEGLALFRLVIGDEEIPGRWVCRARQFVRVEG